VGVSTELAVLQRTFGRSAVPRTRYLRIPCDLSEEAVASDFAVDPRWSNTHASILQLMRRV
jgi:hypothetical protein